MQHLTDDQIRSMLDLAKIRDENLYARILFGWRHGLRGIEIVTLRVRNFDLSANHERGYITVQRVKNSKRTTQELFSDELEILPSLLAGKGPDAFLFPGKKHGRPLTYWAFWNQMHRLANDLGLPWHLGKTHILKHTTGMTLIKKGIENCCQYLGHKSIASTGAYLRVSDAEASRAAMAAFGD